MKIRTLIPLLLLGLSLPLASPAQSFRIAYGSGIRGEIEPCG